MKHKIIQGISAILLILLLIGCSPSTTEPTQIPPTTTPDIPTATPRPHGKTKTDEITSQALANNLLGDSTTRLFRIYLPPGYETSDDRYPVVFALHGWGGNYQELNKMGLQLDSLIENGEARPMIIVYPDGGNAFKGSWWRSSPTIGDYEGYITNELVDYVDANYRTLPNSRSRGITGCSMGGDGAINLAFNYPDVFSVAAPVSGAWDLDFENEPAWEDARKAYHGEPDGLNMRGVPWTVVYFMGGAAIGVPNPDKPPFYLDMPFEVVEGEGQIVAEVYDKIVALAPKNEVNDYLNQPVRLDGILIVQEEANVPEIADLGRNFDQILNNLGIEHEYLELESGHCEGTWYVPVLKFISNHLEY